MPELAQVTANVIPMPPPSSISERGVFNHPACHFTVSALEIRPGMPIDDWVELGKFLKRAGDSVGIWRGDWINYGKHEYKKKYEGALELTGLKEQTLKNDVWISKAIPTSARSDLLTSKHYRHLAPLKSKTTIQKWIDKAIKGDKGKVWSASRLEKEISRDKAEKAEATFTKGAGTDAEKEPLVLSTKARLFLDDYMTAIARWSSRIPVDLPTSERNTIERMIHKHGADAMRLRKRTRSADCEAILKVIKDTRDVGHSGDIDANDLYKWLGDLGYFMAESDFKVRLEYMNQPDVRLALLTDAGEGKQEDRRGQLPWIVCIPWKKVWHQGDKRERDEDDD